MWKMSVIGSLLWVSILAGGCSMTNDIQEKMKYKDIEVHTEDEMKEFALESLKEKYKQEFEFVDDFIYEHEDGEENKPMYLNGYAYVATNRELGCYFEVREPNKFVDDYATNYYEDDIKQYLKESLKGGLSDYEIFISYNLSDRTFKPTMNFRKYLYDDNCCINYTAYVEQSEDVHTYIPLIREWMKELYKADYRWYFELHDTENKSKKYFTLYPGDNGFDSVDDWTDDYIYECICSNIDE